MKLAVTRIILGFMALSALGVSSIARSAPLEVQVINTSVGSMAANVTLLKGEHGAVLVDAPFTRADAYRVVGDILDSGKSLDVIVITHDHPDHFFGLDVITGAFPQARVVANAVVAKDIARSLPTKFLRWSPMLGANAPRYAVFPAALPADNVVMLEGHRIEVHGPLQGDHVHCTYVWVPESKTLIAGDLLYNNVYVWLGEHREPEYKAWLGSLDELEALKAVTIVAGHRHPKLTNDAASIEFTRKYIIDFRAAARRYKTSKELGAALHAAYPNSIDVAGGFLVGVSSQVATGEIPPWNE